MSLGFALFLSCPSVCFMRHVILLLALGDIAIVHTIVIIYISCCRLTAKPCHASRGVTI